MIPILADALGIPASNIIPFREWIERVRRSPPGVEDAANPAVKLVDFLDENFIRMSCGGLLLETTRARQHSPTLRAVGPVGEGVVRRYVEGWREVGFLS
jgi:hypothetical protein